MATCWPNIPSSPQEHRMNTYMAHIYGKVLATKYLVWNLGHQNIKWVILKNTIFIVNPFVFCFLAAMHIIFRQYAILELNLDFMALTQL